MVGRQDVHEGDTAHPVRVVERHPEGYPSTPVVAGDLESLESERNHHLDLVERHAAEGVVRVIRQPARLGTVAVAAQVGRHHGEALRQAVGQPMPGMMRQRIAVQQEQGGAAAAVAHIDLDAGIGCGDPRPGKSFESHPHIRPR